MTDMAALRARRRDLAGLALVVGVFVARGLWFLDFIPLWDGRDYAECVVAAAHNGLGWHSLNCFDHLSAVYIGALSLPQLLAPGSYPLLLVVNLILGALAIVYFHRVLRLIFPDDQGRTACLLVTAAFSLLPVLLASALNPNIDYGVVVFYLPVIFYVLRGQFVRAMLFGVALAFSKESGIMLLGMLAASYVLSHVLTERGAAARWRRIRAGLWMLIPAGLVIAHLLLKPKAEGTSGLWHGVPVSGLLVMLLPFQTPPGVGKSYAIAIFVLSFQWIVTAAVVAGAIAWIRAHRDVTDLLDALRDAPPLTLILYGFLSSLYVMTRFPTFVNVRYFLPLAPLLLILGHAGALRLLRRRALLACWTAVCALFLLSNYYTADPASVALFGTFDFGAHRMLRMTSITGECCGLGRDQLVYNTQFTAFHYLQNRFYADLHPPEGTVLTGATQSNFYFMGPLEPDTFRRTLRDSPSAIHTSWLSDRDLVFAKELPEKPYYLDWPNFPLGYAAFPRLYDSRARRVYEHRGYRFEVYELQLRPNSAELRPPKPMGVR